MEIRSQPRWPRGERTYLEGAQQCFIHAHHCTRIVELSTVIWCRKQRDQMPLCEKLVPVFHDLLPKKNLEKMKVSKRNHGSSEQYGDYLSTWKTTLLQSRWDDDETFDSKEKKYLLTWCARQIRSISCFCKKRDTTSGPNVNDTPLSFSDHPVISLSGSDHSKSHSRPRFL